MPKQHHDQRRHPSGQVDWYEAGQRARVDGRPIFANPATGEDAAKWRAGYLDAERDVKAPASRDLLSA